MNGAIASSGQEFHGRACYVEKTQPREARAPREQGAYQGGQQQGGRSYGSRDEGSTVFVGNVSFQTNKDSVWQFFESCGEVVDVRIATHPDGSMRGFAHVQFGSEEAAQKAVGKAGEYLDGRAIRCDLSGNKPPRTGGRGGGRGGRGGGFGGGRGGGRGGGYGGGRGGGGFGGGYGNSNTVHEL